MTERNPVFGQVYRHPHTGLTYLLLARVGPRVRVVCVACPRDLSAVGRIDSVHYESVIDYYELVA